MTVSRRRKSRAGRDKVAPSLQEFLAHHSFTATEVKAIKEWHDGLLREHVALVAEHYVIERKEARWLERIAALKLGAELDSSTSSRPPARDGPKEKGRPGQLPKSNK